MREGGAEVGRRKLVIPERIYRVLAADENRLKGFLDSKKIVAGFDVDAACGTEYDSDRRVYVISQEHEGPDVEFGAAEHVAAGQAVRRQDLHAG
jgi:hypothetical protein